LTENGGITKKSTRVADRAFPEIKIPWRQPGDFSRSAINRPGSFGPVDSGFPAGPIDKKPH
jgi:hypothetical protein